MERFGRRHSGAWHQQVDATAAGQHPVATGLVPNENFPWDQLQLHTTRYLEKKGSLTPQERDERLVALIQKHPAQDIAMAACAHAMSPQAVRDSLSRDLEIQSGSYYGLFTLLQAIVAANRVNPDAVTELEAQSARALIPFAVPDNTMADRCAYLTAAAEVVLTLLNTGVPTHSLLHSHINALARKACADFAAQLEALKLDSQWSCARAAAAWLSTLTGRPLVLLPANPGPEQLLNSTFPSWKAWAAWQPNVSRLHLWEGFTNEQRVVLRDLLALEGPDFVYGEQATLREGLIVQSSNLNWSAVRRGSLHIKLEQGAAGEARSMLDRLSNALDAACRAGPNDTALLTHFCVGKPVNHNALQILEGVCLTAGASVSAEVLQICAARDEPLSAQMASVMRLLPLLGSDRRRELRLALAPYLIGRISYCMEKMQTKLCAQLEAGVPWGGIVMELQAFGKGLQDTLWLQPLLGAHLRTLIDNWPTERDMKVLHTLRIAALHITPEAVSSLAKKIDSYCMYCLTRTGTANLGTRRLVEALVCLWQLAPDADRRAVALVVAQGSGHNADAPCYCLAQLPFLPDDFVHTFRLIMQGYSQDADIACVDLARLLASTPFTDGVACWRPVLHHMIVQRESTLLDYTLTRLSAEAWLQWLGDLSFIFYGILAWHPVASPAILRPTLHEWAQRLAMCYLPTIKRLEKALGSGPATQCLLAGCEGPLAESLKRILDLLNEHNEERYQPGMQAVIALLSRDGRNASDICEAMSLLIAATEDGISACISVLERFQGTSTPVAEAMLSGWLQASDLTPTDHRALKAVAKVLGVHLDARGDLPTANWEAAADYLSDQVASLFAEAQRLENLRVSLKSLDSDGTSALLASLQIEDPSPLKDVLASLPAALIDVVEEVGEQEVELHFPLTHLTALQRAAMGTGNAQSLLVRLILGDYSLPPGFCMHLGDEPDGAAGAGGHSPWLVLDSDSVLDEPFCHGRANRATYQLARTLSRHLHGGFTSLEEIHLLLTTTLNDLGQSCMICGVPQGVRLRRSTVCQTPGCSEILTRASLDIQLADIRQDPAVVDLLLVMLYATATSNRLDLLPGCPINDAAQVLQLLDELPPIAQLQGAEDLAATVRCLGAPFEALLSWICTSYRGFLASASGQLRIPNMPGAHQFVLANAAPNLESAFAAQVGQQPTLVLFHGTSLDRLYAILCQGLLVCSGGPLQAHGASFGRGIYMDQEPSTALRYSSTATGWHSSVFHNVRVLLGCELANSNSTPTTNMHVVPDASSVMVRYIFLLPPTSAAPLAAHVAPAMLSVFASLRSGVA